MTTIAVKILDIGSSLPAGRTYSHEVVATALTKVQMPLLGQIGMPETAVIDIGNISHQVQSLYIVDDELHAEIVILATPEGQALRQIIDLVDFRPAGIGFVESPDNGVSDWTILHVNAIPR